MSFTSRKALLDHYPFQNRVLMAMTETGLLFGTQALTE